MDGSEKEAAPKLVDAGWKPFERNVGNGLHMLNTCSDNSVSLVIFDPQYRGVLDHLKFGNEGSRQKGRAQLPQMPHDMIRSFMEEIARTLKERGHLFLWVDKFHLMTGIQTWCEDLNLQVVDLVVLDKTRFGMGRRTRRQTEFLVILQALPTRAKGVWMDHGIPDVISESVPRSGHAHRKPVNLQSRLISAVTRPGDLVVDPAAGSFSSMAAAELAGDRRYFGVDLLEHEVVDHLREVKTATN